MAKGTNQKLKLSYLCKIMLEKTDDEHCLTLAQIMKELEKYDISAERKSLYDDFSVMKENLDMDVIKEQIGRETYYHIGGREFQLAEVNWVNDNIVNVAVTRAKYRLYVIGDEEVWKKSACVSLARKYLKRKDILKTI